MVMNQMNASMIYCVCLLLEGDEVTTYDHFYLQLKHKDVLDKYDEEIHGEVTQSFKLGEQPVVKENIFSCVIMLFVYYLGSTNIAALVSRSGTLERRLMAKS